MVFCFKFPLTDIKSMCLPFGSDDGTERFYDHFISIQTCHCSVIGDVNSHNLKSDIMFIDVNSAKTLL